MGLLTLIPALPSGGVGLVEGVRVVPTKVFHNCDPEDFTMPISQNPLFCQGHDP